MFDTFCIRNYKYILVMLMIVITILIMDMLSGLWRVFVVEFDDEVAFTRREMCINAGIVCHDESFP